MDAKARADCIKEIDLLKVGDPPPAATGWGWGAWDTAAYAEERPDMGDQFAGNNF